MQKIIKIVNIPKEKEENSVIRWNDGAVMMTGEDTGMFFKNRILSFGASRSGHHARRYVAVNSHGLDYADAGTLLEELGITAEPDDVIEE